MCIWYLHILMSFFYFYFNIRVNYIRIFFTFYIKKIAIEFFCFSSIM